MNTTILYTTLKIRYKVMSRGLENEDRINKMMQEVVKNCDVWPPDKTGRWAGYVQCLLIEVEKVTTVEKERNFTRPMFHKLYKSLNYEIPESMEI